MKKFLNDNGIWVLIIALLLTAVVSMGSALFPSVVSPVGNAIGIVATPFQRAVGGFTGWVEHMYSYAFEYQQLQDKVDELEKEVAFLREQNRDAQTALDENAQLRDLLNLTEKEAEWVMEDVKITGRSTTSYESTLTISKGTLDGIKEGDCVITGTGNLVGVVKKVGANWATVITLIDPDISMGALVYRTDDDAILEGDLTLMLDGKCKLSYLDSEVSLIQGDEVLSSGKGGVYPSGIVVGNVESVETAPSGKEKFAVIQPAVDLEDISMIFVITSFD